MSVSADQADGQPGRRRARHARPAGEHRDRAVINGELDPAGTDEPLGPVEELTETLHRWVDRGIRPVVVLILLYYGGSQYGSHYISRPFWQNVILWPILLVGFAIVLADDVGGKRAGKPKKVSRWLARKLVARRERKGAPVACQVSVSADQAEDGSGEPIKPLPGAYVYQTAGQGPGPSSRRNAWAFLKYDGTDDPDSMFTYDYIDPDNSTWPAGDRRLVCVAYDATSAHPGGAPVNYSSKGSSQ